MRSWSWDSGRKGQTGRDGEGKEEEKMCYYVATDQGLCEAYEEILSELLCLE